MSLIRHISKYQINKEFYLPFCIDNIQVGLVHSTHLSALSLYQDVFIIDRKQITLNSQLNTPSKRTKEVHYVMRSLYNQGIIKIWQNEHITVSRKFGTKSLMFIERGAAAFLGIKKYGVFLNGYSFIDNELHMWIATRSKNKVTYPNTYDCLVAGAIPDLLSPKETLEKESMEEAGLNLDVISKAKPVGIISYIRDNENTAESGVIFNYDINLQDDFIPLAIDGEVDHFELWPITKVKKEISTQDSFKENCNLVIIDFLIRHGIIDYSYPNYLDILYGLHKES